MRCAGCYPKDKRRSCGRRTHTAGSFRPSERHLTCLIRTFITSSSRLPTELELSKISTRFFFFLKSDRHESIHFDIPLVRRRLYDRHFCPKIILRPVGGSMEILRFVYLWSAWGASGAAVVWKSPVARTETFRWTMGDENHISMDVVLGICARDRSRQQQRRSV
jgi:hypothetical protein